MVCWAIIESCFTADALRRTVNKRLNRLFELWLTVAMKQIVPETRQPRQS